jgi:ABC-type Na+ transport system ATPase subunit NatA
VLTVRENLEFFGEIAGMGRAERRSRADETKEFFA